MEVPQGFATAMSWLGILLIVFAIVDVVLGRGFQIDITGVSWSPLAAGLTGGLLLRVFSAADD